MIDIRVTVDNDRVVVSKLTALMQLVPAAVDRGLKRAAGGVHRAALAWLSGPKGGGYHYVPMKRTTAAGNDSLRWRKTLDNAGGYPVPRRTGHLARMLNWLGPNDSKAGAEGTVTAGRHEVIVYDSASYARAVFFGLGSSVKYGKRDALRDGLKQFNSGGGIKAAIEDEVRKELKR